MHNERALMMGLHEERALVLVNVSCCLLRGGRCHAKHQFSRIQMSLGTHHCFLACMLLSSKQQLPFCVVSVYEASSIYKEEQEWLQPRMQRLQVDTRV